MDYSIDRSIEKIYNQKTKDYFNEVLSSYSIGNYRSAIVMLYSVIIADLFYILKELSERDEDPKATSILEYIRAQISDRDRSNKSEWETKVVEKVFTDTQLLEQSAKAHIDHIKQLRNLSAHPVLDSDDLLATPNKDTVRAAMINALEYVLIKPAMYSDKVAIEFMNNIPNYSSLIFRTDKYETYLKNKYFTFFTDKLTKKVFKFLWIAVYKGQDEQAHDNRQEYFDTLLIVYRNFRDVLDQYFKEEKDQFNRLNLEESDQFEYFFDFFSEAYHLYQYISEANKVIISYKLESNISLFSKAWFVTGDKKQHVEKLFTKYTARRSQPSNQQLNTIYGLAKEVGLENKFYYFCIAILNKGTTYVGCLERWRNVISPFLESFSKKHIVKLLEFLNSNSSLHNANWIVSEYISEIKDYLSKKSNTIEDWDEQYTKLPKYNTIFFDDNAE
jgi:hypothetical protein